jgi:hypothetical protein
MKHACLALVLVLLATAPAAARDWYVHADQGRDGAAGTEAAPLATVQAAVNTAAPGDVIHLGPPGALFRQQVTFANKTNLTLDGHGATLDGSDVLPDDGWETISAGLRRRRVKRTTYDRHLLTFDGRTEHMHRTQSGNSRPFPAPEQLTDDQFAFVAIDDTEGWLYVRTGAKVLEWSTRVNGVATGGTNRGLVVRNLKTRRYLNDGFNIHGHGYDLVFEQVEGTDCFDEGFSAHEDCTCRISDGRFWGCENAVADVNDSQTDYLRCEFGQSLSTDALLVGKRHSLTDCRIINTPGTTALSGGSRGQRDKGFQLVLDRVAITSTDPAQKPRVRISDGTITVRACKLDGVDFNTTGADVQFDPPR